MLKWVKANKAAKNSDQPLFSVQETNNYHTCIIPHILSVVIIM